MERRFFSSVDPKRSTVYHIARQMADRNQDVVGEQCVRNDAGEPSLTEEAKMKAWVEHYSRLMNIEFDWPRDKLPNADQVAGDPPTVTTEIIRSTLSKEERKSRRSIWYHCIDGEGNL